MKKSLYTLFLLLICVVFVFGGCAKKIDDRYYETNAFRLCRSIDDKGQISITYTFPVNSKQFLKLGYDADDVKNYKFYLATYISVIAKSNKEKAVEGMSVTPVCYYKDVDSIGFSINFDSIESQKQFFSNGNGQSSEETPKSSTKTSGFLVKRLEIETVFPFSATSAKDAKTLCQLAVNLWAANSEIKDAKDILKIFDDSIFIYDFSTRENGLKSSNHFALANSYHNVFIKTEKELAQDDKIVFYTSAPNVAFWYFLAIILTILGMIIAYFVKIKQKSR